MAERALETTSTPTKRKRGRPPRDPDAPRKLVANVGQHGSPCYTCNSPVRMEIEAWWASGDAYPRISARCGISVPALRSHFGGGDKEPCASVAAAIVLARTKSIERRLMEREQDATEKCADIILLRLDDLYERATSVFDDIRGDYDKATGRDLAALLQVANSIVRTIAQVQGRIQSAAPVVTINNVVESPQFQAFVRTFVETACPGCRIAVLGRWQQERMAPGGQVVQALPACTEHEHVHDDKEPAE